MKKGISANYIVLPLALALVLFQDLLGQSLSFDGDQDYVNVNTVASEMHVGEADWAVSFWVKPDLSSFPENDSYILGVNTSTGGNALHVGLKKDTGYPIVFEINSIHITGSTGATDQEWNHIVYSKLGYTGTIYLNGVSQGTHGAYHSLYNTHQWTIGGEYDAQVLSNEFVGLVDEVAVWDDDLTAAEVAALYNSGAPLSASTNAGDYTSQGDLQAYWLMNEGSGSTIADATTNNNSGTITGATWSTDTPGSSSSTTTPDYKWTSSDSTGGPVYSWEDITSTGTLISMSGDDNNTGPHPIGFTFPFYGTEYTTFRISTNGWISFTSTSSQYSNYELPGTNSPEAMLAPFWDDLIFTSDKAYFYSDGSQLVITFNDVDRLGQEAAQDPTLARYYANLELPYGADVEAVRESRRRLLKRYHPDLHSTDPARKRTATTVAQGLNRAHDELLSRLDRKEQ